MDQKREEKYYSLLEKITNLTCVYKGFNRDEFVDYLSEFCKMFRISKGVTEFYLSERDGGLKVKVRF